MFGLFRGKVKFFDSRPDKRYGFAVCEGYVNGTACPDVGKEFFFHFNDGEFMVARSKPEFVGKKTVSDDKGSHQLRDPRPDDTIVFSQLVGKKGYKASPWSFVVCYDAAVEKITKRPVFRMFESMAAWGETATPENPEGAKVLWEGSDMIELRNLNLPRPIGRQIPSSDPNRYFWSSDDGFDVRRWWQFRDAAGNWKLCPDPRELTPSALRLRQFELVSSW